MANADYCGYCGTDFTRRRGKPSGICERCYADPVERAAYNEDREYDEADKANERDLADRARRGK